jgi:hypothetical protein
MNRAAIIHQCHRRGGGRVWVHKRHGGWRTITFNSGPTQLAKLLGLASVLNRVGSATTTVVQGQLQTSQAIPAPAAGTPAVPRDGPDGGPVQIAGP